MLWSFSHLWNTGHTNTKALGPSIIAPLCPLHFDLRVVPYADGHRASRFTNDEATEAQSNDDLRGSVYLVDRNGSDPQLG